jgi:very-short-patch-repair endonuclease
MLELGFGDEAIKTRLASARLSPIHGEVYAVGHRRIGQRGWWWAAVLAYGPDALLSHRSAAALWGLWRQRGPVDVTAPGGRQGVLRRKGAWIHRCRIDLGDRADHAGLPVTTVARTIFDFAEVTDYRQLKGVAEEADRLTLLRLRELEAVCERGRGRRALRPVRRLLTELAAPSEGRSPLEQRFHAFCREHRLPEPVRNVHVLGHEVDALWPGAKLVAELDSWEFHRHRAAFERDRARDPKLLLAGYRTIRITHRRLDREAPQLTAEIHQLLRGPGVLPEGTE